MSVPVYKKQYSLGTPAHKTNPFDSDSDSEGPSREQSVPVRRTNQSVQELEDYAITKAQETTHKVNDCVRAAEAIREDATQTMLTLHRQGEQIVRSHQVAADIEQDLTVSEKLLGSLGGLFSKSWRPKRNQQIKGPVSGNNYSATTANHMEQRWKLGIAPARQERPSHVQTTPVSAMEKNQAERAKQDDALSDLCSTLGQLKEMAVDMGTEIDRQNKALVPFSDDVDELNFRLKGANQRGCWLLGK
ncbi:unnamed protein product [Miscanthus lutarioriparius]|uniref:t-SNARE coiled-coil homology domain-containing protein n=1 Tax=Miscanthus lutarioriparius TaxID=422564 RepID=A0A811M7B9_9POAL|nr:unnamed protein product [Miscanthus lutarioriparius]